VISNSLFKNNYNASGDAAYVMDIPAVGCPSKILGTNDGYIGNATSKEYFRQQP